MQREAREGRDARARTGSQRVVYGNIAVVNAERGSDCRIEIQKWRIGRGTSKQSALRPAASTPRLRLQNSRVRDPGIVALHNDVEIILQGKFDRILQTQIEFAVLNQLVDAWRIGHGKR